MVESQEAVDNQMKGDKGWVGRLTRWGGRRRAQMWRVSSGIAEKVLNWLKQQAIDKGKDIQSREARADDMVLIARYRGRGQSASSGSRVGASFNSGFRQTSGLG